MKISLSLKSIKRILFLFTLAILNVSSGCKKDIKEEPENVTPKLRMTKWEQINFDDTTTHFFEYNSEGKVSKYTYVLPYEEMQGPRNVISTYQYGVNGKIATEDRMPSVNTGGKPIKGTYTYTTDGKLEGIEYKDNTGKVTLRIEYEYSDGAVNLKIANENNPYYKIYNMNFDDYGNIKNMEYLTGATQYTIAITALKYDASPNVFSTITGMESLYMAKADVFQGVLTKNNILSYSFAASGATINVSCKYNEYGYIAEQGDLITKQNGYIFTYEKY